MLQDAIWADTERLASDDEYAETTVEFLKAVIKGWVFARDNVQDAAEITVAAGSSWGPSHELWMANETNKLIWPAPDGIGVIDEAAWRADRGRRTRRRERAGPEPHHREPPETAYDNEYIEQAIEELGAEVDTTGDRLRARGRRAHRGRQLAVTSTGPRSERGGRPSPTAAPSPTTDRPAGEPMSTDTDVPTEHRPGPVREAARQGPRLPLVVGPEGLRPAGDRRRLRLQVWDHAGTTYLDFSCQLVNVNIGHQHPKVVAAIQEQAGDAGHHRPGDRATCARGEAAERITVAGAGGPRQGVLHQRRRRRDRERDPDGAAAHRTRQGALDLPQLPRQHRGGDRRHRRLAAAAQRVRHAATCTSSARTSTAPSSGRPRPRRSASARCSHLRRVVESRGPGHRSPRSCSRRSPAPPGS